jgi:abhydrolase domain-containing protein 11
MIGVVKFGHTITNPTLFVYGSLSDYIKESDFNHIKTIFNNVQFKKVDGSGHWIHAEKPIETLKIITDFFH